MKRGTISLPLHRGHAPAYLVKRMNKLAAAISKIIIEEYGTKEFLKRLSDPLWFQAFGCVLGFDWHSSGLTTVVTGVLKQSIKEETHDIFITGGKGKRSIKVNEAILNITEKRYNFSTNKINKLTYASKITAKIDNSVVQDGYTLYHHVFLFDKDGNWSVVQQGLNCKNKMARRYHWLSDKIVSNFLIEPHIGIIGDRKETNILDMTSRESEDNRKTSLDILSDDINNIKSKFSKIRTIIPLESKQSLLDKWITTNTDNNQIFLNNKNIKHYEMPKTLNWKLINKIYDIKPKNYEEFISIPGVGYSTIRAIALISELIYGDAASWKDPVKYNFAHGGKDGVPYSISRKTYDKSIKFLNDIIDGSEIERLEKKKALKRLSVYSINLFNTIG
ncbi:MAG: DUF763 domain-containing protein [Nitrososphaeraceae archaeon]